MSQDNEEKWIPERISDRLRLRLNMILNEFDLLEEWAKQCEGTELLAEIQAARVYLETAKTRVCQGSE